MRSPFPFGGYMRLRTLLVCGLSIVAWSSAAAQTTTAAVTRSYTASNFVLELDGVQVGAIVSTEGGSAFGGVVKETGEDFFVKKHLGFPGYHDIRFEVGPGMEKTFFNWISQSLQGKASPMNGAILSVNYAGTIVTRLEFTRAQITEVTIPAAEAASKENIRILIGLTPEQTFLNRSPGPTSSKIGSSKAQRALS